MKEPVSLEDKWKQLEQKWEHRFGKIPNMEALLFLIGANEYKGRTPKYKFSKEEKQDLMHVGTCTLLQQYGYYALERYDEEGWPHFIRLKELDYANLAEQEKMLKMAIVHYFDESGY